MSEIDPVLCPSHVSDAPAGPLLPSMLSGSTCPPSSSESSFHSCTSSPAPTVFSSSSASLPDKDPRSQGHSTSLVMADASINPRYTSQMRPNFVERVVEVHERAERKRMRHQEALQDKKKILESVVAFSFFKNDEPPLTVELRYPASSHSTLGLPGVIAAPAHPHPCAVISRSDM